MKEEVLEKLKKYNQEHLKTYMAFCTEEEKESLEQQILNLDFEILKGLYETTKQENQIGEKKITHIPYVNKEKLSGEERKSLEEKAKEIISTGKYAVVTMAGGQGTRLRTFRSKRKLCIGNKVWSKILI